MTVTIYHNPRCSKSRQTLALLREHVKEPEIIQYLENPPTAKQLTKILRLLNLPPRGLMRQKVPEYKSLGLDDPNLVDSVLIAAMSANPKIIERPIVVNNNKAILGRPPENVLQIL